MRPCLVFTLRISGQRDKEEFLVITAQVFGVITPKNLARLTIKYVLCRAHRT